MSSRLCPATFGRKPGAVSTRGLSPPIVRIDSGTTYSLFASGVELSEVQLARDPGYAQLPGGGSQTLFFGERGSETFPGYALFDLGLTYGVWYSFAVFLVALLREFGWSRSVLAGAFSL